MLLKNMLDLSIVIVNFNAKEYLKKCLDSIFESKLENFEVIVVDNFSKDGSVEEIKSYIKRIANKQACSLVLLENKKNTGFSAANNQGIKKATGRYILFLNPDTIVYPNTFKIMVDFMDKDKNVGAATCKVLLLNGELDDSSHRGFPTPWNSFSYFLGLSKLFPKSKLFSEYTLGFLDLSKIHEIDSLGGAFMLVRRQAGEKVGWWDEDYFFYGEDIDFCFRLKEKGWKIYFVPNASILHHKGLSSGIKSHSKHLSHADLETQKAATVARYDAMKIFYRKHYSKKYSRLMGFLVNTFINLKFWISLKKL